MEDTITAETAPAAPMGLLDRVLRDRAGLTAEILSPAEPRRLLPGLVAITAAAASAFGLALGLQAGIAQALVVAVKFPLILLGAAGVSLPLLHVGCALCGVRLRAPQLSMLVLQALSAAAVTMAGLAPLMVVTWLTISLGSDSPWFIYRRLVLAAAAVASVGGLVGASRILRVIPLRAAAPWAAGFGLAGLQLTWLLRPIVGMPEGGLVLLRPLESNGLAEVLTALWAVLS